MSSGEPIVDLAQKEIPSFIDVVMIQATTGTPAVKTPVGNFNAQPPKAFATIAALTAAVSSPVVEQHYYVVEVGGQVRWDGTSWVKVATNKSVQMYNPTITAGSGVASHNLTHGLGRVPSYIRIKAACSPITGTAPISSEGIWQYNLTPVDLTNTWIIPQMYNGICGDPSVLTAYIVLLSASATTSILYKLTAVDATKITIECQGGGAVNVAVRMLIEIA